MIGKVPVHKKPGTHGFAFFSGLAIFIALLGIIGLTYFFVNQREKEISIRKLLGSGIRELYWDLTKNIIFYVIIANVLAIPLTLLFSSYWREQFAYSIPYNWTISTITLVVTLCISLLAISRQVLKAAYSNPLHRLRHD